MKNIASKHYLSAALLLVGSIGVALPLTQPTKLIN